MSKNLTLLPLPLPLRKLKAMWGVHWSWETGWRGKGWANAASEKE
jgi:hypothetical protein